MTSPQERGKKSECPQEKLMYESIIRGGKLSILEKGDKYLFYWERGGRRKHRSHMALIISGKFLCNLDNEVGDLARQIYQTNEELSEVDLWDRRKIQERLHELGEQLLPHLIGDEGFGKFENPEDALDVVKAYFIYQTIWQISQSPRERAQLENLGEF